MTLLHEGAIEPDEPILRRILASPWIFVPAIYLIQGILEGGVLQFATAIMYKDMGYSNAFIGYLSFLHMPLIFAFLWAPYVDRWGTKRSLSIVFFFTISIGMAVLAAVMHFHVAFTVTSLAAFFVVAAILSFFRIATDGYYIRVLDPRGQAAFVGIKAAGIRIGMIGAVGILVMLAGRINTAHNSQYIGWFWMYVTLTFVVLAMAVYNYFFLPKTPNDVPVKSSRGFELIAVTRDYLKMDRAVIIIAFILVFRFGQALLARMAEPFFMDPIELGGVGMNVETVSMLRSFAGIPWMIVGGISGGFIVKKWGLKKTFVPLATLMAIPNLGYWYIAGNPSDSVFTLLGFTFNTYSFLVVCIESVGYGMGFSGFFYYLHALAQGKHKTSLFAISTALMGLGWYIPCALSGVIQEATSYQMVFFLSVALSVPGILMIPFLPMPKFETEVSPHEK